ncbi:MAG: hypothetical protein VR65_16630 [Desulfobulbaceae bacterium BRH_c16a]|nr:MAG: hypothetical protein VR65_16630 [Desulfobulbaceae bacterium BRH_c16a]
MAVILSILLFVQLGLFGCAGMRQFVSEDNRILFSDQETSQGVFDYRRLTVEYSYALQGDNLTLTGRVFYSGRVDSLNVYVLFFDATGTVMQEQIVYFSGYRTSRYGLADSSFEETMVVPPTAAGISFGYSAQHRTGKK